MQIRRILGRITIGMIVKCNKCGLALFGHYTYKSGSILQFLLRIAVFVATLRIARPPKICISTMQTVITNVRCYDNRFRRQTRQIGLPGGIPEFDDQRKVRERCEQVSKIFPIFYRIRESIWKLHKDTSQSPRRR